MRTSLFCLTVLFTSLSQPVASQTVDEFFTAFSGSWFVFDPQFASGTETCEIRLDADGTQPLRPASASNCAAPLSELVTWTIGDGQLDLRSAEGATIVRLGGNQQRVTGDFSDSGRGLILERADGSGRSAELTAALRRHRCFFAGYTADCVGPSDLRSPAFTELGGTIGEVETLVDLNVRSQPRAQADPVGVVPAETCVRVNQCIIASDGVWCRARFGEQEAWLAKTVLRQDEWPVMTFSNGCNGS